MNPVRPLRRVLGASLLVLSVATCGAAFAQEGPYPNRAVRVLVPFPAGGTVDLVARMVATQLSPRLGQPVVVENRTGAAGNLAAAELARARPDGYTLLITTQGPITIAEFVNPKPPYVVDRDLAPVAMLARTPLALVVNNDVPAKTLPEFLKLAKDNPGKYSYGSPGTGNELHLMSELIRFESGVDIVHVPYRGTGPVLVDVLAGRLQMMIGAVVQLRPHIQQGKVRALAAVGQGRSRAFPDLPSTVELGLPTAGIMSWFGMLAPAGTPRPVIDALHAELQKLDATPAWRDKLLESTLEPGLLGPKEFGELIARSRAQWRSLIERAGLKLDSGG